MFDPYQLKGDIVSQPLLLNIKETVAILGGQISQRSVWRWSSTGKFPRPVKLGGRTLWRWSDIQKFINDADGNFAKFNRLRRGQDA